MVPGVPAVRLLGRTAVDEPLDRVGPDRLQRRVPGAVRPVRFGADQVLVHQAVQPLGQVRVGVDPRQRGELEPAGEHAQPVEQVPGVRVEQVDAPVDRAAQGLLPPRPVPRDVAAEVEVAGQLGEHLLGGQRVDVRGGQLDGQRQAVQAPAQLDDRGEVVRGDGEVVGGRPGAGVEQRQRGRGGQRPLRRGQRGRVGQGQRRYPVHLLAVHAEPFPAAHQYPDPGRGGEQLRDQWRGADDVLVVVEDQQEGQRGEVLQYRGGQRLSGYLGDVQRLGEERHHEVGAGRVGQRYEHRAVGEPVRDGRADRERQPRLADPGRADQGDQPAFGEQLRDLHGLVLPPDQLGDGYRQLVCVPLRLGQQGRGDGQGAVLRAYQMPA